MGDHQDDPRDHQDDPRDHQDDQGEHIDFLGDHQDVMGDQQVDEGDHEENLGDHQVDHGDHAELPDADDHDAINHDLHLRLDSSDSSETAESGVDDDDDDDNGSPPNNPVAHTSGIADHPRRSIRVRRIPAHLESHECPTVRQPLHRFPRQSLPQPHRSARRRLSLSAYTRRTPYPPFRMDSMQPVIRLRRYDCDRIIPFGMFCITCLLVYFF